MKTLKEQLEGICTAVRRWCDDLYQAQQETISQELLGTRAGDCYVLLNLPTLNRATGECTRSPVFVERDWASAFDAMIEEECGKDVSSIRGELVEAIGLETANDFQQHFDAFRDAATAYSKRMIGVFNQHHGDEDKAIYSMASKHVTGRDAAFDSERHEHGVAHARATGFIFLPTRMR